MLISVDAKHAGSSLLDRFLYIQRKVDMLFLLSSRSHNYQHISGYLLVTTGFTHFKIQEDGQIEQR